jgi:predicted transcriptional regulator
MTAVTVHLPKETAVKLDRLVQQMDQPQDDVVAQAIEDFVARSAWQTEEIAAGLAEVERGEFAEDDDVSALLAKYVLPVGRS